MSDIPNAPPEAANELMKLYAEMVLLNTQYVWKISSAGLRLCAGLTGHLAEVQRTAFERHESKWRYGQQS